MTVLISSCTDERGEASYGSTKVLLFLVIAAIALVIRYLKGKPDKITFEIPSSIDLKTAPEKESIEEVLSDGGSPKTFYRQLPIGKFLFLALLPPVAFCFIKFLFGLCILPIFILLSFILYKEERKKLTHGYNIIDVYSDKIVLSNNSSSEIEEIHFKDVKTVHLINNTASGAYGIQTKVGEEIIFKDAEDNWIGSFDYKQFGDGDTLKKMVFESIGKLYNINFQV